MPSVRDITTKLFSKCAYFYHNRFRFNSNIERNIYYIMKRSVRQKRICYLTDLKFTQIDLSDIKMIYFPKVST